MKKLFSIILVFCSLFLFSCNKNDQPINDNYVMINDFETIDDVILNSWNNLFGQIGLNDNENFVTSNKKSLMMRPTGDINLIESKPKVQFKIDKEIRDLTKYSHVKFDIYNDSDKEVSLILKFTFNDGNGALMSTSDKTIKLAPKAWTNVLHRIDAPTLSLIFNVNFLSTIDMVFDFYDEAPTLYMDNFTFRKSEEEFKEIEIVFDEDEICSFDKDYQSNAFIGFGYGAVEGIVPELMINTNPLFAKEGNSLKMTAIKGDKKDASWPYIQMSPKIVKSLDLSKYDSTAEFVCDIYNDSKKNMNIEFGFHKNSEVAYKRTFGIQPKQWTEIRIPFSEINSQSEPGKLLTNNLSYINICYGEFVDSVNRDFYFDSIRIEK